MPWSRCGCGRRPAPNQPATGSPGRQRNSALTRSARSPALSPLRTRCPDLGPRCVITGVVNDAAALTAGPEQLAVANEWQGRETGESIRAAPDDDDALAEAART